MFTSKLPVKKRLSLKKRFFKKRFPFAKEAIGRKILLVLAVAMLILPVYIWQAWLLPQEEVVAGLEKECELKAKHLSRVGAFARSYPDSKGYLNELDRNLAVLEEMLPGDAYISEFLIETEENLKKSSATLLQVRMLPEVVKGSYKELPLEMVVQGSFEEILKFHQKLQDSNRFVSVVSSSTSIKDISQHNQPEPELESKITLVIYSSFANGEEKIKTDK